MKGKIILFLAITMGCSTPDNTEIHQSQRNNIINAKDKIQEIAIEEPLISGINRLYSFGQYLLITDFQVYPGDNQIHLFDKKSFRYITSTAPKGEGPGEITNIGHTAFDPQQNLFYVTDHAKQKIFAYNLDSVLEKGIEYKPFVKTTISNALFPSEYLYVNDTLCLGRIIQPIGNSDYKPMIARWNMKTDQVFPFNYENNAIKKKRATVAISPANNLCVEAYDTYDLMTLYTMDGNLICNIYGPQWDDLSKVSYFQDVIIAANEIITTYQGTAITENGKRNYPTRLVIFDLKGNYLKTLETGYNITSICYDKEYNRILLTLNDAIQFAALDMKYVLN